MRDIKLKGKVALIVGGGGGPGRMVAQELGQQGAIISLADVFQEQLLKTAVELSSQAIRHTFQLIDRGDAGAAAALVQRTVDNFGRLDVVITISDPMKQDPLVALSEAEWKRALRINVTGAFLTCLHGARVMRDACEGGRIITIVADRTAGRVHQSPHYCPVAGAVVMFTKALAGELASFGITANSICPGFPPLDAVGAEREQLHQPSVDESNGLADLGALVSYLASPEAGSITGVLFSNLTASRASFCPSTA